MIMNIIKIIKEVDKREAELLFNSEVELSNGNTINFDCYGEIGGTASYIHIENSIYVLDYYECEDGVSYGMECIYGEESTIHLEAIGRKLDI